MGRKLRIKLTDGDTLEIDLTEWHTLASSVQSSLQDGGDYLTETVSVSRHGDGRTLVYVTFDRDAAGTQTATGELLPEGTKDIEKALWQLAKRLPIPMRSVEKCVQQIKQLGN